MEEGHFRCQVRFSSADKWKQLTELFGLMDT